MWCLALEEESTYAAALSAVRRDVPYSHSYEDDRASLKGVVHGTERLVWRSLPVAVESGSSAGGVRITVALESVDGVAHASVEWRLCWWGHTTAAGFEGTNHESCRTSITSRRTGRVSSGLVSLLDVLCQHGANLILLAFHYRAIPVSPFSPSASALSLHFLMHSNDYPTQPTSNPHPTPPSALVSSGHLETFFPLLTRLYPLFWNSGNVKEFFFVLTPFSDKHGYLPRL